MKARPVLVAALTIIAFCAATPGCADHQTSQAPVLAAAPSAPLPPAVGQLLPPLPTGGPPRLAGFLAQVSCTGQNTHSRSGDAVVDGDALLLNPSEDQLSYAIYEIGSAAWEFDAVDVEIQYDDATKVWFGIGDYSLGTWRFRPASPGVYSIPAPSGKLYSSTGFAYFAVLAYGDTSVRIQSVSVEMDLPDWEVYTFEGGGPAASFDIALVGERLYMFYQTGGAELMLAWANIAEPADAIHWTREPVFSLGAQIGSLDIEEIAGQPALAFYIGSLGAVAFYQGLNATPADPSDWTMFTLDYTVDSELALAEIWGRPALIYLIDELPATSTIAFAYSGLEHPEALVDWELTTLGGFVPTNHGSHYLSLSEVAGTAAVGYFQENQQIHYFVYALNDQPLTGDDWSPDWAGYSAQPGFGPHIAEVEGKAVLVYRDLNDNALVYAEGKTALPETINDWLRHPFRDDIGNVDFFGCCNIGDGLGVVLINQVEVESVLRWRPFFCWFDEHVPSHEHDWKQQDVMDAEWGGFEDPDGLGDCCYPRVAASVNGMPHLVFYDSGEGAIKIAHFAAP